MIAWLLGRNAAPTPRRTTAAEVRASLESFRTKRTLSAELDRRVRVTAQLLRDSGAVSAIAPSEGWRT